jgi:hypothetical protein
LEVKIRNSVDIQKSITQYSSPNRSNKSQKKNLIQPFHQALDLHPVLKRKEGENNRL